MNQTSFSRATLTQRLDALFPEAPWHRLPGHSDLTLAEGRIAGRDVLVVATDPAIELGTFGTRECNDFLWALQRARATGAALLLLVDSAGARLNAGLPIQGALRSLMRDLLDARLDGLPVLAVLGRYAFGAASMLACAASRRLHSVHTLTAMSGPKILAAQAASPDEPESLRAMLNGRARSSLAAADDGFDGDVLLDDALPAFAGAVRAWMEAPQTTAVTATLLQRQRRHLRQRLRDRGMTPSVPAPQDATPVGKLAWRGGPLGAAEVLELCERLEQRRLAGAQAGMTLHIDSPGHSTSLLDEQVFLSQYLVHLALSLRHAVRNGADLRLLIERQVSGGVYIALAAGTNRTELAPGAMVRTLPEAALQHILGDGSPETHDGAAYLDWGVVDVVHPAAQQTRQDTPHDADKLTLA